MDSSWHSAIRKRERGLHRVYEAGGNQRSGPDHTLKGEPAETTILSMTAQAVLGFSKDQTDLVQEALLQLGDSLHPVTALSCLLLNTSATPPRHARSLLRLSMNEKQSRAEAPLAHLPPLQALRSVCAPCAPLSAPHHCMPPTLGVFPCPAPQARPSARVPRPFCPPLLSLCTRTPCAPLRSRCACAPCPSSSVHAPLPAPTCPAQPSPVAAAPAEDPPPPSPSGTGSPGPAACSWAEEEEELLGALAPPQWGGR